MTKKTRFIPVLGIAALSASFGTAWAQSSVQLTGVADMYLGSIRMAGDTAQKNTVGSGGMTTSWWGLKGNEDLGGGTNINFALTSYIRMADGSIGRSATDTPFSRDANVGMSSSAGALTLGRWMAPDFMPSVLFNPFANSTTFSPLMLHADKLLNNATHWGITTPADTGWSNQIAYTTPDFDGLKATLQYQFADSAAAKGKKNFGGNVIYLNGSLGLTAFYESAQLTNPVVNTFTDGSIRTDWMLGSSYDFSVVKLYATYGQASNNVTNDNAKTSSVGASVPIGAGKLLAAYANTHDSALDAIRQTLTVGYDYNLSKQTDLYANVMRDQITGSSSGTSVALGMRHSF